MSNLNKHKDIVIFGFLGIGDMIEFSPCFKLLKQKFPNSSIVLVTIWKGVYELFKKSTFLDEVIFFDFFSSSFIKKIKFFTSLKKRKFFLSVLPYPSYRREFNLVSRFVNAKKRCSFRFHDANWFEFGFLNNYLIDDNLNLHNVQNNFQLLSSLGINPKGNEPYELPISHSESFIKNFIHTNNITNSKITFGIHPGSDKRGKERRLDISTWSVVCDELTKRYDSQVLVFFGPHEIDLKEEFISQTEKKHVIVEGMSIDQTGQIISICDIFLSGDSGLMHLASAMKVPSVVIYGPTNPTFNHPWQVPYEIVSLNLSCSPCFYYTEKHSLNKPLIECKIDDKFACIRNIETRDILNKTDKMIQRLGLDKKHGSQ